jgi:hypothetical protein
VRRRVRPGLEIAIEERNCNICNGMRLHDIQIATNGMGEPQAEIPTCREHRVWSDGRIEIRREGWCFSTAVPDEKP